MSILNSIIELWLKRQPVETTLNSTAITIKRHGNIKPSNLIISGDRE